MFQQSAPSAVSADYCLVSDHESSREGFSSQQPPVMMELSPCSSNEEQPSNHPSHQSANLLYSSNVLASMKSGTAQAYDLIRMNFTKMSNLLFFAGAFCQLLVAIWDLKDAKAVANGHSIDDDNYTLTRADKASYLFFSLGPLLYAAKAVLDVRRSWQVRSQRDERWNIAAAVIFFVGALFAIYDSILWDAHEDQDDADDDKYMLAVAASRKWFGSEFKMNEIATHLYLISGAIYLSLHTGCFHGWQQILSITAPPLALAYRVLIGGTTCFVVAAIVDAALAYFYDPETLEVIDYDDAIPATDLGLARAKVASCFLWNLAPAMYIMVDILVQRYTREHMNDPTNHNVMVPTIGNEVAPFI